jgi:hypothetical protein
LVKRVGAGASFQEEEKWNTDQERRKKCKASRSFVKKAIATFKDANCNIN